MKNSFASRARKAIVAGVGGGLTAIFTSVVFVGAPTKDDLGKAIGAFVVGFGATAWATFRVKNAPAV